MIEAINTFAAFADDGNGYWITLGARGEEGDKHGGSAVYVQDGVITKGARERAEVTPQAQLFSAEYDREQKAFAALPKGTRVLITDGGHGGRIGTVVKDFDGNKVKLDNSPGLRSFTAASVEPLHPRLSWRCGEMEEPPVEKPRQMSMFAADACRGRWVGPGCG